MFSIFHFFADLTAKRPALLAEGNLEAFPFDDAMLSCRRSGLFPDMAIRVNPDQRGDWLTSGGELIELKDSKSYSVASFNSTIPTGVKEIAGLVARGNLGEEMESRGNNIHSLPVRQVYYLLRGRKGGNVKVCLTHGSFFETVSVDKLIRESFRQALETAGVSLPESELEAMSAQGRFAASRKVDRASVSLRFRIITEARREANIFKTYDEIGDNTLNMVVPLHGESESKRDETERQIKAAARKANIPADDLRTFRIKHPFNGYFLVLQVPLKGA